MQPRLAKLADVNACCQLNMTYVTDYVWQMRTNETERATDIHFDTVRLPRPMRVDYPRLPEEFVDHWEQKGCFFVLNDGKEVVAFIDAIPNRWQNMLWIANLAVASPYRRQGIATRLLQAAHEWALHRHLGQITLELQTKNYPAICFAQKHGFQYCGYNERYYLNGDIALFFTRSI